MDYAATYLNMFIRYHASDITLHVDSDTTYIVAPKACSRIAGYFSLSNHPKNIMHLKLNGAALVEYKTLRDIVASLSEVKVAGGFHNAQVNISTRHTLELIHHPQPPTCQLHCKWFHTQQCT